MAFINLSSLILGGSAESNDDILAGENRGVAKKATYLSAKPFSFEELEHECDNVISELIRNLFSIAEKGLSKEGTESFRTFCAEHEKRLPKDFLKKLFFNLIANYIKDFKNGTTSDVYTIESIVNYTLTSGKTNITDSILQGKARKRGEQPLANSDIAEKTREVLSKPLFSYYKKKILPKAEKALEKASRSIKMADDMVLVSLIKPNEEEQRVFHYTILDELFDSRDDEGAYDFQNNLSCLIFAIISTAQFVYQQGVDEFKNNPDKVIDKAVRNVEGKDVVLDDTSIYFVEFVFTTLSNRPLEDIEKACRACADLMSSLGENQLFDRAYTYPTHSLTRQYLNIDTSQQKLSVSNKEEMSSMYKRMSKKDNEYKSDEIMVFRALKGIIPLNNDGSYEIPVKYGDSVINLRNAIAVYSVGKPEIDISVFGVDEDGIDRFGSAYTEYSMSGKYNADVKVKIDYV